MADEAGTFGRILARHYDPRIQITPPQVEAIAGAILSRRPACNLLVFGAGLDSALWSAINAGGRTLFVEDTEYWAAQSESRGLAVRRYAYPTTVAGTLAVPDAAAASAGLPDFVADTRWDVILIDGPAGWQPQHPGRALPIVWATRAGNPATHIFLHDCERQLEASFAQRFLLPRGPSAVVPRAGRERQLLWSIGLTPEFSRPATTPGL